jgi:hypothetical protein
MVFELYDPIVDSEDPEELPWVPRADWWEDFYEASEEF